MLSPLNAKVIGDAREDMMIRRRRGRADARGTRLCGLAKGKVNNVHTSYSSRQLREPVPRDPPSPVLFFVWGVPEVPNAQRPTDTLGEQHIQAAYLLYPSL